MCFQQLISRGPGSPEELPCSTWALCGVVVEYTHVYAQEHSVAGSGWAVFCIVTVMWAGYGKTLKSLTHAFTGWVRCGVVSEHKHVCNKAMLMMLLQLPGFGSWAAAAAVVVVAVGCVFSAAHKQGPR